ncbi:TonB-dependent receptor [Saccharophagus degradans]|uniref:TonB-dependent receptor n=1 Tax=Saccharophagus degradans TaxID=86304 RepID=UPI003A80810D
MRNKLRSAIKAINYGSITTAAVLGMAAPVFAQDAGPIEEVTVTGIRSSLTQSIDKKRDANAVVDAITAEDIGKFPDKNVADSLSRITGIGVSREFGEGEKITVRGASPSTNRTLLNGQSVASADWFILDVPSRSFNYTLLPSALVSSLEVYKSPVASMDEGSLGGTVVLTTRRPLDLPANAVSVKVEGQYSETSGETDPQLSAMYSWKNDDETIGLLVSGVSQQRKVVREGVEILGWRDTGGVKVPSHIGVPRFEQERDRQTVFASAQFAPSENLDFTLNVLKSKMDSNNHNQNWLIFPNNEATEALTDPTVWTSSTVEDGNLVAASVATGGSTEFDFINRRSSTETQSVDLDINYFSDSVNVHAQIGSTDAKGGTYREASYSALPINDIGYTFDLRGTPELNTTVDSSDPTAFAPGWIWGGKKPTTDKETYAQVDFELPIEAGVFTAIKTGIKLRDAERTQERAVFSWHGPNTIAEDNVSGSYLDHVFATCTTFAVCGLGVGTPENIDVLASGNMTDQMYHDQAAFEEIAFVGLDGVPADYAVSLELAQNWEVSEKINALYVQGDFEGDGFRGNMGVRYVSTKQTSGGYEFSTDSWGFYTIDREWLTPSSLEWVTTDNSYSEILPSFNVAFDLNADQILRFSSARVMSRQNWNDISASESFGSLNQAAPAGTRSNPLLNPQIADQFDISWEWYFDDASLLSATYFFKDIKSYRSYVFDTSPRYNEETEEFVDVTFQQPVNGLGGTTDGLELSYQQGFGDFGVVANYTYTNATNEQERDETSPGSGLVEGTSDHMMNLTGYYENDVLSARLMYNYRTEWYKGLHFNGDELWNDAFGQWDASFSYNVTDNVSLSLEAINLLNEEVIEYNTDKARVMSLYQNGRRIVAGVSINF